MALEPVSKDLGLVTAYGYAKEGGYTGTEEEFRQSMAIASKAVKRIGKEDFSNGWADEGLKGKVGEVGYNQTLAFDFVNHSRKTENWDNFILIFATSTYFRPDNYSWGSQTVANSGNNWDFSKLKSDMDGALVHVEVINWRGTMRIMFTMTTAAGVFRYQWYDLQGTFSSSAYSVALTVDHAYADLYLGSVRVYQTGLFENKPFAVVENGVIPFRPPFYLLAGTTEAGRLSRFNDAQWDIMRYENGVMKPSTFFGDGLIFIVDPDTLYTCVNIYRSGNQGYINLLDNNTKTNAVLNTEKLQQSNQLVTRVGSADFSTTLGGAWYKEVEVPHASGDLLCQGVGIKFRNYSDKAENWHNGTVRLTIKTSTSAEPSTATEYTGSIYLRMDDFAFTGGEGQSGFAYTVEKGNNWDWATFKDDLDGALCEVFVQNRYVDGSSRNNYKIRVDFKVLTTAGKVYRQWYVVTVSSVFIASASINLTVENAYLDVDNDSFYVVDYPKAIAITVPDLPVEFPGVIIP